jgi:hypothetical protein
LFTDRLLEGHAVQAVAPAGETLPVAQMVHDAALAAE